MLCQVNIKFTVPKTKPYDHMGRQPSYVLGAGIAGRGCKSRDWSTTQFGASADNQELTKSQEGQEAAPCTTITHTVENEGCLCQKWIQLKVGKVAPLSHLQPQLNLGAEKSCQARASALGGGTSVNITTDMEHGGQSWKCCFKMSVQNKLLFILMLWIPSLPLLNVPPFSCDLS